MSGCLRTAQVQDLPTEDDDAGVVDAGVVDAGANDAGLIDSGTVLPSPVTLAAGSGFIAVNWAFPKVGESSPTSFSVAWRPPGGSQAAVSLSSNVRRYDLESVGGTVIAYGSAVTVTVTATYPNGIPSNIATATGTMLAAAPPTELNTGPRLTQLTVNTASGNFNGYNQTVDANDVVHYTGVKFTGGPQVNGTQGGPTTINGYIFTDCEFTNGIVTEGSVTGDAGIVFDHCVGNNISSITNPGGSAIRTNFTGVSGSPLQLFRHDPSGLQGSTTTSTPWAFIDCAFKCPYPTPENGGHFEAVHIRGAKDVTFTRCSYDVGWNRLPDGGVPALTANIYIEGGFGGNDNIVFSNGWHYGAGPYYGLVLEGTNVSMVNERWARNGNFNDLSNDGNNQPGPSVSIQTNGGQVSSVSLRGNVWEVDGTGLDAGFLAQPSGNGTIRWY